MTEPPVIAVGTLCARGFDFPEAGRFDEPGKLDDADCMMIERDVVGFEQEQQ